MNNAVSIKNTEESRSFRDLVTSDSWREYNGLLGQLEAQEINKLLDVARQDDLDIIKKQAGVVDGIQKVITITKRMEGKLRGED